MVLLCSLVFSFPLAKELSLQELMAQGCGFMLSTFVQAAHV